LNVMYVELSDENLSNHHFHITHIFLLYPLAISYCTSSFLDVDET